MRRSQSAEGAGIEAKGEEHACAKGEIDKVEHGDLQPKELSIKCPETGQGSIAKTPPGCKEMIRGRPAAMRWLALLRPARLHWPKDGHEGAVGGQHEKAQEQLHDVIAERERDPERRLDPEDRYRNGE